MEIIHARILTACWSTAQNSLKPQPSRLLVNLDCGRRHARQRPTRLFRHTRSLQQPHQSHTRSVEPPPIPFLHHCQGSPTPSPPTLSHGEVGKEAGIQEHSRSAGKCDGSDPRRTTRNPVAPGPRLGARAALSAYPPRSRSLPASRQAASGVCWSTRLGSPTSPAGDATTASLRDLLAQSPAKARPADAVAPPSTSCWRCRPPGTLRR